ncbi:hypothetical protein Tco_1538974 [Tanacetum coccineum]
MQKIVDSWKNSSKNLWKLDDSEEDYVGKPLYNRFSKTNNFKGVPHPLTGDYTPKPQEEIDDSLYVYGKKGPQKPEISDSADNSTKHSTCQSNDSEGSFGNPSEHSSESESESISVPNEMSTSKSVTANEKVVSESKEVEPSCVTHVKTPRKQMKNQETHEVKRKNWNEMMGRELGEGYSFIKKKCFVCGSLSHLIKDCDYYEKKMAREAELKKQRVFNTGNGVAKLVWNNAHRVNHANHFVPRPVQLNDVRQNVNSVRPNVNTGRVNVTSVRHNVNSVRTNVNTGLLITACELDDVQQVFEMECVLTRFLLISWLTRQISWHFGFSTREAGGILPPIQYQRSRNDDVIKITCVSPWTNEQKFLLRETRMAGKGCALHHWVHDVVLMVSNQLDI